MNFLQTPEKKKLFMGSKGAEGLTCSDLDLTARLQLDPGDLFTSSSNNWRTNNSNCDQCVGGGVSVLLKVLGEVTRGSRSD